MLDWLVQLAAMGAFYASQTSRSPLEKNSKAPEAINIYIMDPYRKANPESSHDSLELYNLKEVFIQIKLIQWITAGQNLSIAGLVIL